MRPVFQKLKPDALPQQRLALHLRTGPMLLLYAQDLVARRRQDALQATQEREREDDAAVLGLLEIAAQQVGDTPEETCEIVRPGHGSDHCNALHEAALRYFRPPLECLKTRLHPVSR